MSDPVIVHVLAYGQPMCNTVTTLPKDWPEGHVWVPITDPTDATCQECLENLKRFHTKEEECESH